MSAATVVLGWGNPSRGDDALGPLLCRRLEAWLPAQGLDGEFEVVEDFQLQVEHALDLVGRRQVLFVDALADAGAPFEFRRLTPRRDASHSSHALSPQAVLAVFEQIHATPAPPAYLLGIRGQVFELGEGVSAAAAASLEAAWTFVQALCLSPADWPRREAQR